MRTGRAAGRIGLVALAGAFAALAMTAAAYAPAKSPLMTPWGEKITPANAWREYPRPQMVRPNWTNLNGEWDYAVTAVTNTPCRPWDPDGKRGEIRAQGKILVPFGIEAPLSGVGRLMEPDELLWYTRKIQVEKRRGERILLHFDGVDFRAMVFIGHGEVTDVPHFGAQEPFTLDVTDYVKTGENDLTVCVWDPTDQHLQSRGKQTKWPQGCTYTRYSGIWQSVWMETVPESYVASYRVVPDIDAGTVTFTFETKGPDPAEGVEVEVLEGGKVVAKGEAGGTRPLVVKMPRDFMLWSPETPNLYTFRAKFENDAFTGYFAMRKISKGKGRDGYLRFFLNDRPYFPIGTLDQGWWPDGLLTPPSDEAMAYDIMTLKACGFNMMRKHIKVEPLRYYYLCDKLGILVFQDMPCSNTWATEAFDRNVVNRYGMQRYELRGMLDTLFNVPSIVMWIPYNEGWSQPGEFLTHSTLDFVKRYDPSRLVNGPSGWQDFEGGEHFSEWRKPLPAAHKPAGVCEAADVVDKHEYRGPAMNPANDRRISLLGEFGGLGHPVEGHLWRVSKDANWGYGGIDDTKTREGLEKTYLGLMDQVGVLVAKGLAGTVYTQTTDVEIEINGMMTYDRKVLKFNPDVLHQAHDAIRSIVEK